MHVISASRRMDLPAFQMEAFMAGVRRGWIDVPHPFTGRWERVSLSPDKVAGIVFWTRQPGALLPCLDELRDRYHNRLRIHFTLTGLPRELELRSPEAAPVLDDVGRLAEHLGADHLSWRFDPILLSEGTPAEWWKETFARLAESLQGKVSEVMLSWLDLYARSRRNLLPLEAAGFRLQNPTREQRRHLLDGLVREADTWGLPLKACCEPEMLEHPRIEAGACLDGAWFEALGGLAPGSLGKQPSRSGCGCCQSKDIGIYNSCAFGCRYCYANRSPNLDAPANPWQGSDLE